MKDYQTAEWHRNKIRKYFPHAFQSTKKEDSGNSVIVTAPNPVKPPPVKKYNQPSIDQYMFNPLKPLGNNPKLVKKQPLQKPIGPINSPYNIDPSKAVSKYPTGYIHIVKVPVRQPFLQNSKENYNTQEVSNNYPQRVKKIIRFPENPFNSVRNIQVPKNHGIQTPSTLSFQDVSDWKLIDQKRASIQNIQNNLNDAAAGGYKLYSNLKPFNKNSDTKADINYGRYLPYPNHRRPSKNIGSNGMDDSGRYPPYSNSKTPSKNVGTKKNNDFESYSPYANSVSTQNIDDSEKYIPFSTPKTSSEEVSINYIHTPILSNPKESHYSPWVPDEPSEEWTPQVFVQPQTITSPRLHRFFLHFILKLLKTIN